MSQFYTNVFSKGNRIFVRGYKDGVKYQEVVKYKPRLFVGTSSTDSDWVAFPTRQTVEEKEFDDIKSAKDFIETYNGVTGFKIFGQSNFVSQYIGNKWTKDVPFDIKLIDSMVIDIETTTEFGFPDYKNPIEEILLISCKRKGRKTITFGCRPVEGNRILDCEYRRSHDERSMLVAFVKWFHDNAPDVLTGWNIEGFDIPYMCARIARIHGEDLVKQLSPFGYVDIRVSNFEGKEGVQIIIQGVSILDYLPLYKKFPPRARENYKLDFIATYELGEKKLSHDEFSTFKEFYEKDFFKFVSYNVHDCVLVERLNDKLNILEVVYGTAYLAKMNFNDAFSPVRTWESFIYNYLLKDRITIPISSKRHDRETFAGGHVKETIKGNYNWIVSFDLTSMYPHNIIMNNISPETLTGEVLSVSVDSLVRKEFDTSCLKEMDYTLAGNGQMFRRDIKGLFPAMMKDLFGIRNNAKLEMKELEKTGGSKEKISQLNVKQGSVKLLLNCLFGATGNPYFKYYDLRMAEGITLTGQVVIQWMERKMNEKLNKIIGTNGVDYVIASDTDSLYINFGPLAEISGLKDSNTETVVNFFEKVSNGIFSEYIAESLNELAEYLNAIEPAMSMKLENICDRGIFIGSKNYILNVHSSEGVRYKTPKLKLVGIGLVKSSTPAVVRDSLKESIPILLYQKERNIQDFVCEKREKFFAEGIEEIAFPRGINDIDKWVSGETLLKGIPVHVRAAVVYNRLVKELGLTHKYHMISEGSKMKFVYLKTPNPVHQNVVGFIDQLPPEFNLHKYVDYEVQFEKAFLSNLEAMCKPLKWGLEKKTSMEDWGI